MSNLHTSKSVQIDEICRKLITKNNEDTESKIDDKGNR